MHGPDTSLPCPPLAGSSAAQQRSRSSGTKAFFEEGRRGQEGGGRAGARGEFSRRPGESGSMYGASVFADEYAAQQTQLVRASGAQQREPAVAAQGAAQ